VTKTPLSAPDAAHRRFVIVHTILFTGFAVVMAAVVPILARVHAPWLRWLIALGPVVLLALWGWEFVRMIRRSDEMMRATHMRAVAISAGPVLLAGSLWDILARLLPAPGIPMFLMLPAAAIVYGVAITVLCPPPPRRTST
jgi:hypothetical protein